MTVSNELSQFWLQYWNCRFKNVVCSLRSSFLNAILWKHRHIESQSILNKSREWQQLNNFIQLYKQRLLCLCLVLNSLINHWRTLNISITLYFVRMITFGIYVIYQLFYFWIRYDFVWFVFSFKAWLNHMKICDKTNSSRL